MTGQDHARTLGFCLLAYGTFTALMLALQGSFAARIGIDLTSGIFKWIYLCLLVSIASVAIAAYTILLGKTWARIAGVVASIFLIVQFPVGTIIAAYTLWYLFGVGNQRSG